LSTLVEATNQDGSDTDDGYIDWQVDTTAIDDASYSDLPGLSTSSSLPAVYDMRVNNPERVPGLRDQRPHGDCWAFANAEAAESTMVATGVLTDPVSTPERQISTNHLVHAVFSTNTFFGGSNPYGHGGNSGWTAAAWSHWFGPQPEAAYPDSDIPSTLTSSQLRTAAYHLRNWWVLPSPHNSRGVYSSANTSVIKSAILKYGAVTLAVYIDHSYTYFDPSHTYFYDPHDDHTTHLVTIVGWDNTIAASNFTGTSKKPTRNGAFLIQNSWGDDVSYYYISYDDNAMSHPTIFVLRSAVTTPGYRSAYDWTTQYAYDTLGWVTTVKTGSRSASFANKYTAKSAQALRAVQFVTAQPNTSYKVSVYLSPKKSSSPTAGGKAGVIKGTVTKTISGKATYSGYQTVTFPTPLLLKKGQKFSVVIKQSVSSGSVGIPVEGKLTANPGSKWSISAGQSYIYRWGAWHDAKSVYKSIGGTGRYGNTIIIALASPRPQYLVTYNANGGAVASSSKSVTFKAKYGTLPTPQREGYTFKGWYTAKSGGKRVTSQTVMTTPSAKTVYARWATSG